MHTGNIQVFTFHRGPSRGSNRRAQQRTETVQATGVHGGSQSGHRIHCSLHELIPNQPDRARVATQILRRNSGRLDVVYPKDTKDDADTPWEEVVMNIQGYIVEKNLPPIVRPEQSVTH